MSILFIFLEPPLFLSLVQHISILLPLKYNKQTIMVQVVETLKGVVTCDGHSCTHVVTGKARRTMNFCIALCSGYVFLSFVNQMTSLFQPVTKYGILFLTEIFLELNMVF